MKKIMMILALVSVWGVSLVGSGVEEPDLRTQADSLMMRELPLHWGHWKGVDLRHVFGRRYKRMNFIMLAARDGDIPALQACYDYDPATFQPNIKSPMLGNSTALHFAAQNNILDTIFWLVAHGADIHAKDNKGRTPLDVYRDYVDKNVRNVGIEKILSQSDGNLYFDSYEQFMRDHCSSAEQENARLNSIGRSSTSV